MITRPNTTLIILLSLSCFIAYLETFSYVMENFDDLNCIDNCLVFLFLVFEINLINTFFTSKFLDLLSIFTNVFKNKKSLENLKVTFKN